MRPRRCCREVRFRDLTVDNVMARTAMKRSNFYTYFNDRNDLVMRLVDRIAGEMFAATEPWLGGENPDRVAALRQGLRAVVRIWSQHADVLAAMHEASHQDEAAQQYFRGGIVQEYIDQIAALIRREKRTVSSPCATRRDRPGADPAQRELHDRARDLRRCAAGGGRGRARGDLDLRAVPVRRSLNASSARRPGVPDRLLCPSLCSVEPPG